MDKSLSIDVINLKQFKEYPSDFYQNYFGYSLIEIDRGFNDYVYDFEINPELVSDIDASKLSMKEFRMFMRNDTLSYCDFQIDSCIKIPMSSIEILTIDTVTDENIYDFVASLVYSLRESDFKSIYTEYPGKNKFGLFTKFGLRHYSGSLIYLPEEGYVTDDEVYYSSSSFFSFDKELSYKERIEKGIKLKDGLHYLQPVH